MNNRKNATLLVDASQFKTTITVKGFFVVSTFSSEWVDAGTKKTLGFAEGYAYDFTILNRLIPIYMPDGTVHDRVVITQKMIKENIQFVAIVWMNIFGGTARIHVSSPSQVENIRKKKRIVSFPISFLKTRKQIK